jgi:hypothetical protein
MKSKVHTAFQDFTDTREAGPVTKRTNVSIAEFEAASNLATSKAKPALQQGKSKTSRDLDFLIAITN